jgi:hypothetical protein
MITGQLSVANIYVAAANGYLNLIQQYVNNGGDINQVQNVRPPPHFLPSLCSLSYFEGWKHTSDRGMPIWSTQSCFLVT